MYSYSSVKIVPIGTQKNPFGNSIPKGFEKKNPMENFKTTCLNQIST